MTANPFHSNSAANVRPGAKSIATVCLLTPLLAGLLGLTISGGCSQDADHGHAPGAHGGIIIPVGHDHFHVEALFTDAGELKLFTLGQDETHVTDVETQELQAFIQTSGQASSKQFRLQADPQPGDAPNRTTAFKGKLPDGLAPGLALVVVPSIRIGGQRYRFSFTTTEPLMPAKVVDDEERRLYLEPGGLYSAADIESNGRMTASEKYRAFHATHDSNPKAGDRICPVTKTKANPECTWTVNGESYQFCCPPCIDEFVKAAKEKPSSIAKADSYRK